MSDEASELRGRTVIRPQAIRRVAEAVTAAAAGVRAGSAKADLADRRGELVVRVSTPVTLGMPDGGTRSLVERGSSVADEVTTGLRTLTGRSVGEVLVHFSGVQQVQERRVR